MLEEIADAAETESVVSAALLVSRQETMTLTTPQAILAAQNTVMWGGAPLRESAGDYLVQNGVRLIAWGGW